MLQREICISISSCLTLKLLQDPTSQGHHETQGAGTDLTSEGQAQLGGLHLAIVNALLWTGLQGIAILRNLTARWVCFQPPINPIQLR